MVKIIILVFVGGAIGSMLREFIMLTVPQGSRGFPLDILVANLLAAFVLGFHFALHERKVVSHGAHMLVGTGIAGGLSTFSSFAYASSVLMSASTQSAVVATAYVAISLVLGYIAVFVGMKIGNKYSDSKNA